MVRKLEAEDFRSARWILEPDDFLIAGEEEQPPSDLITEELWHNIVGLPDDVSVRTSSHYGTHLRRMYELSAAWIDAAGDPVEHGKEDAVYMACLEAADEFSAAIYNALCGYYRVATSCLRTALEPIVIGTHCELAQDKSEYEEWRAGSRDISFGRACDMLRGAARVVPLEAHLEASLSDSIFGQRRSDYRGGSARRLHAELSKYAHSAPGYTSFEMWNSTGPVFEPTSFIKVVGFTYETSLLCFAMVKLARAEFRLPEAASGLFHAEAIHPTRISRIIHQYLFDDLDNGA